MNCVYNNEKNNRYSNLVIGSLGKPNNKKIDSLYKRNIVNSGKQEKYNNQV